MSDQHQQLLGITRSISACKRCRKKKIKCSHDFPRCTACLKANTECVSLDPATGREIPRSYIVHLENRIAELENYLKESSVSASSSPVLASQAQQQHLQQHQHQQQHPLPQIQLQQHQIPRSSSLYTNTPNSVSSASLGPHSLSPAFISSSTFNSNNGKQFIPQPITDGTNTEPIIDSIHTYNPKRIADDSSRPTSFSGSGISFSKLMFAAVHFKDGADPKDKERRRSSSTANAPPSSTKPPIDPTSSSMSSFSKNVALLPPKQQALDFVSLYFDQSNSQLPIFHREEFLKRYFIPIYGEIPKNYGFASSNTINNNNTINWSALPQIDEQNTWYYQYTRLLDAETGVDPEMDPFNFSAKVAVPRRFKKALYFINIVFAVASSIWHLQYPSEISENFKNAALLHIEDAYSSINRLEALQAMLCLTLYSLMRPCVPGVWYLSGSSLRLCIDLGLHNESNNPPSIEPAVLDMRRRLFWCCYSLDRQICVYLGRPFGIPEESIKVQLPSILDDSKINDESTMSSLSPKNKQEIHSYKNISLTMFRIRQLQAEIQSILYDNKEIPRSFPSLSSWFTDITLRLDNWKSEIQKIKNKMNCAFTIEFFDLNYYHAKMMLHGLAPARYILTVPDFVKLADASKGTLLTFYKLWNRSALNYTWAVTQNVFMAHMNFLYAIFHCPEAKYGNNVNEVTRLSGYANVILKSLINRCNAAEQCAEVLTILSQAVIKLKYPDDYAKQKELKENNNETNNNNTLNNDNSSNPPKSNRMKRLPSEDEVKTLQPGGHMTGNMRRLIVSIPELMNAEEKKSTTDTPSDCESGDRKRVKIEAPDSPYPATILSSNNPTPNVGSLALTKGKDQTPNAASTDGTWALTESDMDRFFDEVRKVESPESSRSYSHFSTGSALEDSVAPEIVVAPRQQPNNMCTSSSTSSAYGSGSSPAVSIGSNRSNEDGQNYNTKMQIKAQLQHHHYHPQQTVYPQQPYINNQFQIPQQYPPYQNHTQSPSNVYSSHLSHVLTPTFPQQYTAYPSPSMVTSLLHTSANESSSPASAQKLENTQQANPENTSNSSTSRKHSREGQRVFKLMYETGTESIWDQFFAQPFKLDEI